jgi:hypothetical protein
MESFRIIHLGSLRDRPRYKTAIFESNSSRK